MTAEVFESLEKAHGRFGPCALAIGNFDGVHLGHRELIREVVQFARAHRLTPAAITFDPHPTSVVAPSRVPLLICPLAERLRLMAAAGLERIFVLKFTEKIAKLLPEEFVSQILVEALESKAVFVGENFRFGYKQMGTPSLLQAQGERLGYSAHFLKPVQSRGTVVSSTAIRENLLAGKMVSAARLLGRCFSLTGPVVSGRGIGSKQAVPTLNLRPQPGLLIPKGIFVTETFESETNRRWPSVTSCGYNPTFGATDLTVETYLLRALEGPSPQAISVNFRHFLRHEETYPDAPSLKTQILKDVARSEAYWRHANAFSKEGPRIY